MDCVQNLNLNIGPSAAPSLAGALCVLFDACVVAMARAEGYFKIALRPPRAPSRSAPRGGHDGDPHAIRSVKQARESSVMSLSDGDASLLQTTKKMRTDIGALTHALPMCRNLQPPTSRA